MARYECIMCQDVVSEPRGTRNTKPLMEEKQVCSIACLRAREEIEEFEMRIFVEIKSHEFNQMKENDLNKAFRSRGEFYERRAQTALETLIRAGFIHREDGKLTLLREKYSTKQIVEGHKKAEVFKTVSKPEKPKEQVAIDFLDSISDIGALIAYRDIRTKFKDLTKEVEDLEKYLKEKKMELGLVEDEMLHLKLKLVESMK